MKKMVFALLAALLSTAAAPVPARRVALTITIFIQGDHLRLHFHTAAPVYEIAMTDFVPEEVEIQQRQVRLRQWRPATPGLLPYDGRLARQDRLAFQDADLDAYPDDAPVSWGEPMVIPSGGGFVVDSRYLLADPQRFDTTMDYRPRPGELLYTGAAGQAPLLQREFFRETYLGPVASLSGDPYLRIISGNDVPGWARTRVGAQVTRSMQFFQSKLGQALPWAPTLVMAALPEKLDEPRSGMMGKATPNGILTFRFFGADSLTDTEGGRADLEHIASHEVFHFWDASVSKLRNGGDAPWLYEGGADYVSMLARRALGQLDGVRWNREIDRQLAYCRTQLGARGLAQLDGGERHSLAYPCGVVIQWVCDLAIQRATRRQGGIFDLWRMLIARAKAQGGFYSLADFRSSLAAYDPKALATVDSLLMPDPAGDRWNKLRGQMEAYGVRTGPALQNEWEVRIALFRHLLAVDCADTGGFQLAQVAAGFQLRIQRPACRHFGASTEVRTVEGRSLRFDTYGAYAAAIDKCASGLPVDVILGGGQPVALACAKPLPPLIQSPQDFTVVAMP